MILRYKFRYDMATFAVGVSRLQHAMVISVVYRYQFSLPTAGAYLQGEPLPYVRLGTYRAYVQ
jgi:hypothetical protein